ncbi:ABC transporter permease subunit [Oleomonas cavernae]|uniref:ABC transporter permease subunit n=1 Tax=Oleomonas cavernae TaxID=2320859 RepID=A0A418WI02_9PROT|nr:ABC transporter permease subunit [Oleomonas cavernae]RJF89618.1 ABC transporter permease subunit [Oleomonas cavernae]
MKKGLTGINLAALTFGFAFLYVPILILIFFSFNESRIVNVWGGFSLKWYGELFQNEDLLAAAWVSLVLATATSTLSVILGTIAGFVMARFTSFRGRTLFSGMVYAPLVMPEVITGLSLLLLFVAIEWSRGLGTMIIAHTSFCMSYVAVVVQSRLVSFDRSIEEAAQDLGATPLKTFFVITLPVIAPALVSGWLLSFTLSLDNVVISSFTSGPGWDTLPIKIFSAVKLGVKPEINALSTIMITIVAVGVIFASILQKRATVERQRAERMAAAAND